MADESSEKKHHATAKRIDELKNKVRYYVPGISVVD